MRTSLLVAFALTALAVPTAAALGLPVTAGADVRVGDVSVVLEPPAEIAIPAVALDGIDLSGLVPVLSTEAPIPMDVLPTTAAAPAATTGSAASILPPAPPAEVQAVAASALVWILLEKLGLGRAAVGAIALLYSRLAPNELLDHDRRERVVALVRSRPGVGPQEIGQTLGMNWGVTSYHLDRLEGAGLLVSQRIGQHRCYFVPGAMPRDAQAQVGLFRGDTTRRVAQLVREKPGIGQSELAAALGLSASATSKQVSRLETAELVRREASGNGMRLFPQPALEALPA